MKKNENIKTCGMIIREAREEKEMTINDLAFELRKYNVTEKDIKAWENDKAFPDLNTCYQLAYIININPTEILVFRDRQRKAFIKRSDKPKKKWFNISEETKENIYYVAEAGIKIFIILIAAFVARAAAMTFDSAINGDVDGFINTVERTIEDNVNQNNTVFENNIEDKFIVENEDNNVI